MKFLSYYYQVCAVLLPMILSTACTRRQPDVPPADDGVYLSGVTIPGFPSENISIDQINKEIVLTVPANASATSFDKLSFQTSPGSYVWQADHKYAWLCGDNTELIYVLNDTKSNAYRFVVKQPRQLAINFIDNQTKATIGQSLAVRIDNMIDGKGGGVVILTRTDTGEQDSLFAGCQAGSNQYMLAIPQRVRPGDYTVAIHNKSGRTATAPQKLTFQKGTTRVDELRTTLTVGQSLTIGGSNLFADDAPELRLRRSSGETVRLKAATISPYGWFITTDLPATTQPGYYDLQIGYPGKVAITPRRVAIRRDDRQPTIEQIGNQLLTASTTDPIILTRKQYYSATIQPQLDAWGTFRVRLDIKLTAVGELGQSTRFTFSDRPYNSDYPPALIIPTTVQPGRYLFSVVATYTDGIVSESEPLERLIEVQ